MNRMRCLASLAGLLVLAAQAIAAPLQPAVQTDLAAGADALLATRVQGISVQKDEFGRVISVAGRPPVACPTREQADTVLFVFGQSNSANSGAERYQTRFPGAVYNYFNGSCYVAASPLIGTNNTRGEWLTMMADRLIDAGLSRTVIIIPAGIGGTTIAQWVPDGRLGPKLAQDIADATQHYNVTEIIWHQGESDYRRNTTTDAYISRFLEIQAMLRRYSSAPIYVSVASRCNNPDWAYPNQVTEAQMTLGGLKGLVPGVNTDELVPVTERRDGCHFNGDGQRRTAEAYMYRIWEHRYAVQQALAAQ
jgi:lysophospholipase L1-like esterase